MTSNTLPDRHGRKGFACKQFFVAHDKCAMKVSTDSLLLGSFSEAGQAARVLDVGTGSGILALMMAQKTNAGCYIDALDIDPEAVQQARENVAASPWPHKVSVQLKALQTWSPASLYNVIITNPPYFHQAEHATRAYDTMSLTRGQARNESGVSMQVLMERSAELTTPDGRLNCMYPYSRYEDVLATAAQSGWHIQRELVVSHNTNKAPYLCLFELSKQAGNTDSQTLAIRTTDNQYSDAFKRLCRAFYLNF